MSADSFLELNKELLQCYTQLHPYEFRKHDFHYQKRLCEGERLRVEKPLLEERVKLSALFNQL